MRDGLFQGVGGLKEIGLGDRGMCKRQERGAACCGHAERAEVSRSELLCCRKGVCEGGVAERDRPGHELDQLRSETTRGGNADLLTENGADGDLEGIPSAGRPQTGLTPHRRGKSTIAREVARDGLGVGIEVKDTAETRCDDGQRLNVLARDLRLERVARGEMADGDDSDVIASRAVKPNDAAIGAVADFFYTGDGAWNEEGEQRVPVEWRPIGETQNQGSGSGRNDGATAKLA